MQSQGSEADGANTERGNCGTAIAKKWRETAITQELPIRIKNNLPTNTASTSVNALREANRAPGRLLGGKHVVELFLSPMRAIENGPTGMILIIHFSGLENISPIRP